MNTKNKSVTDAGSAPRVSDEGCREIERNEWRLKYASDRYDEVIKKAAERLRDAASELERSYSSSRVSETASGLDVATWAINHASQITGWLRLDLLARYGAEMFNASEALKKQEVK